MGGWEIRSVYGKVTGSCGWTVTAQSADCVVYDRTISPSSTRRRPTGRRSFNCPYTMQRSKATSCRSPFKWFKAGRDPPARPAGRSRCEQFWINVTMATVGYCPTSCVGYVSAHVERIKVLTVAESCPDYPLCHGLQFSHIKFRAEFPQGSLSPSPVKENWT